MSRLHIALTRGMSLHTLLRTKKPFHQIWGIPWIPAQSVTTTTAAAASSDRKDPVSTHNIQSNPYFGKYADKIRQQQTLSPEEFQAKLENLEESKKKEDEARRQAMEEAWKAQQATQIKPKKLDEVMKLDLISEKSAEEIEELWKDYHSKRDVIFAVVARNEYEEILARSQEFGTFTYPLPRQQGYEFVLQQFCGNEVHFTPLIQYQTQKENAPPCLTITYYTELIEDKGIVLMVGEPDLKVISVHEAQLLALQVKMYYGLRSSLKFNLVRLFNNFPQSFRHMDLIKEFENFKTDYRDSKELKSD